MFSVLEVEGLGASVSGYSEGFYWLMGGGLLACLPAGREGQHDLGVPSFKRVIL